jgi:hypothetical protein
MNHLEWLVFVFFLVCFIEPESCYVTQPGLKLTILLSPKCGIAGLNHHSQLGLIYIYFLLTKDNLSFLYVLKNKSNLRYRPGWEKRARLYRLQVHFCAALHRVEFGCAVKFGPRFPLKAPLAIVPVRSSSSLWLCLPVRDEATAQGLGATVQPLGRMQCCMVPCFSSLSPQIPPVQRETLPWAGGDPQRFLWRKYKK